MSRDEGFAVMDVSVDLANDPKIRRLWRHAPSHAGAGYLAYTAILGESWKAGRRMTIDETWPAFVPFDRMAVDALVHVGLLDRTGRIPPKSWRGWFEPAQKRREKSRDRWRKYNAKREENTASLPRGTNAVQTSSVPPVTSRPYIETKQGRRPLDGAPVVSLVEQSEKTA